MSPDLRRAIDLASQVRQTPSSTKNERELADALISYFGAGSLIEQNRRLEDWAKGADDRVGRASQALDDAGVGAGNPPLEIGERVRVLAAYRDEWRKMAVSRGAPSDLTVTQRVVAHELARGGK